MNFQVRCLLIVTLWSVASLSIYACECNTPKCFDCTSCNKDCTNLRQNCDSDCIVNVKEFLCKMENENCKKQHGCDVPPVNIVIYPAINYDESKPQWKAQTIQARKNCCYNLSGMYNNSLSGLNNNGASLKLYDGPNCTGKSITVDSTWSADCLKWIDCTTRTKPGGIPFNDVTSSFELS